MKPWINSFGKPMPVRGPCPVCGKSFRSKGACPTQWCDRHERWECGRHLLFLDQWTCEITDPADLLRLAAANELCQ